MARAGTAARTHEATGTADRESARRDRALRAVRRAAVVVVPEEPARRTRRALCLHPPTGPAWLREDLRRRRAARRSHHRHRDRRARWAETRPSAPTHTEPETCWQQGSRQGP